MQQQQPAPDLGTLSYRMNSLEQHVQELQSELRSYVPARENDLQLQIIRSTVERIESDVATLSTQFSKQTKAQDQLQINVLKWFAGIVVTVLVALLIAHLTHFV